LRLGDHDVGGLADGEVEALPAEDLDVGHRDRLVFDLEGALDLIAARVGKNTDVTRIAP
jgi:hypothetical protein